MARCAGQGWLGMAWQDSTFADEPAQIRVVVVHGSKCIGRDTRIIDPPLPSLAQKITFP